MALRNGRATHLTTADGLADNSVQAICADNGGTLWLAAAGIVQRFGRDGFSRVGDGLPGTVVTAMVPANAGGVWLNE